MSAAPVVEVSPPWRPALGDIVIEPTEKHTATVVFLHGLGDSGRGWADIVPAFGLRHIKFILPSAESRPITINGGFPMNGWFDVLGLGPSTKEDVPGLDRAAAHVISILAKEKAKAGPESPVRYAVGGFSQGGSLALHVATSLTYGKYLDGKPAPSVPLTAAACISGWLSGSDVLAKGRRNLDAGALERAGRLPILHCHGTVDPVVNFQFGKLTAETLKGPLGFSKTKFNAYNGVGHSVSPEEVADIRAWLLEHLPPA
ncbi:lysophospholipase II [Klebsormidium nitens]|uniref:Lysophospholipase II n=1 Tax=Klebsormidium nitens TaxID=105231 RepID=A0A1Y1HZJ6_KLENI|nr:lysophospholipase II [Klebsormidium nitens]|eukprot:GAQ84075.1 lysophospholipase II [Klebsormidium nitens]